jgi:hypothetical protein
MRTSFRRMLASAAVLVFAAGTIIVGSLGAHLLTEPAHTNQRAFGGVVVPQSILKLLKPTSTSTSTPSAPHRPSSPAASRAPQPSGRLASWPYSTWVGKA